MRTKIHFYLNFCRGGNLNACSNFMNSVRCLFGFYSICFTCSNIYVTTEINVNVYNFTCENITKWMVGGGDKNACSNVINLAINLFFLFFWCVVTYEVCDNKNNGFFLISIIMMFSYETEWGRGNIHASCYFINAARYLFWYFPICLICSNIYLKQRKHNLTCTMYFFSLIWMWQLFDNLTHWVYDLRVILNMMYDCNEKKLIDLQHCYCFWMILIWKEVTP